jgi:hypothetical protein
MAAKIAEILPPASARPVVRRWDPGAAASGPDTDQATLLLFADSKLFHRALEVMIDPQSLG